MFLIRGNRYDGTPINIVMDNVLFFGSNDKGGTLFVFNTQQPAVESDGQHSELAHQHIVQSEKEVFEMMGILPPEEESSDGQVDPSDDVIVNKTN
jgi:hypothetical protein